MIKRLVILLIVCIANISVKAQGCSDAGFCTIGDIKPHSETDTIDEPRNKITLIVPGGLGDDNVLVITPGIQYEREFSKHWSAQAKITGNYASGNLGSVTGPGDVFFSGSYHFKKRKHWESSVLLGTKIPLSQSNQQVNGRSLPMQYQSSLGTFDLITGFTLNTRRWQFSAAYQQPLSGMNGNNYMPNEFVTTMVNEYPPSRRFNRKSDVLARVSHTFHFKQKFNITPGLLSVYHLSEDTYVDADLGDEPVNIRGSAGLTLNLTLSCYYKINKKFKVGFLSGTPLIVREVRPDGLTRSIVFSPEIIYNF